MTPLPRDSDGTSQRRERASLLHRRPDESRVVLRCPICGEDTSDPEHRPELCEAVKAGDRP